MRSGRVIGVSGNLVTVEFDESVSQNEVAYVIQGGLRLISEVIRVRGRYADVQVFESTAGIKVGDPVEFEGDLLSVELGPGLLARVFDGLQNPLNVIAERHGFFLPRGELFEALPRDRAWEFSPRAAVGDRVRAGDTLGVVKEELFEHRIMVPFGVAGAVEIAEIAGAGEYTISDRIAVIGDASGKHHDVAMLQTWPVKRPIRCYAERLRPTEQLVTKMRVLDTFFPVAKGGTFCVPGPFGAGKTVLQQLTSRHADVDVVIVAACGERAGEVVETLREFPVLTDPLYGAQPDGADRHHLQHELDAGGGPRGLRVHGGHHRRVLPADGPARTPSGRLHVALGPGASRDVGAPGRSPAKRLFLPISSR